MKRRSLLNLLAISITSCPVASAAGEPQPLKDIKQLEWMIGDWAATEPQALEQDVPGLAEKGAMATMHTSIRWALADTIIVGEMAMHANGKKQQLVYEVYATNPETGNIRRWAFGFDETAFEGEVLVDGDTFTVKIEGEAIPRKEVLQEMPAIVQKLIGDKKFAYSADVYFKKIDADTMSVTVDNVKVNGQPIPWPGAGKENVMKRAEE